MNLSLVVNTKLAELSELCESYPDYIPIAPLAKFLGCSPENLRCAIEQGKTPFGFSWQKPKIVQRKKREKVRLEGEANKGYKVPTATFIIWYTGGRTLDA